MPEVVQYIDVVARRLGRPVLMAGFGREGALPGLDRPTRAKRVKFLGQLDREGIAWTPCGPPSDSGWLSYLGHVYFDIAYAPGEPAYERLRCLFEDEAGELLVPEIRFLVYQQGRVMWSRGW